VLQYLRYQFYNPLNSLHELFKRIVFNILIGNTDDHARNHAAFWDGTTLSLTPAYDICPQARTGQIATQAMNMEGKQGNHSTLVNALSICHDYKLEKTEAKEIINTLIAVVSDHWLKICQDADLSKTEREHLWKNAVLNPYCFEGWQPKAWG
jgi:serine/threonine-protein kinase HipA